jgi:dihydroorotase
MLTLLKQVLITDTTSPYFNTQQDILIENGIIKQISSNINTADKIDVIEGEALAVSPGWIDLFANFAEPGYEYREGINNGINAALAGGYTQICLIPNTNPVADNKSTIEFLIQKAKNSGVNILPLGAVSKKTEGTTLAEMYDMHFAGAIAFTDGLAPLQSAGLLLKALQYVKSFNGTIIQIPIDKSIGTYGLINEGIISTQLGLPGSPALAEELCIQRDIELLKYTQSKLHITGITTAKSVALIQQAKEQGLAISCSVTPHHLFFCDEDLQNYNTNLKVNPPLRTNADKLALQQAVANGIIDCIATHHLPYNVDEKVCEFQQAQFGCIGLQTAYAAINTCLPQLDETAIAKLLHYNVAKTLNIETTGIKEHTIANLTVFTKNGNTTLTSANNKSNANNSPFLNLPLKGKVICTINHNKIYKN